MRDGQSEREGVNEIGRAGRDKKKEGGWLTWQWRHGAEDIRSSLLSLRTMCGRRCCQLCTWSGRPVAEPVRQRYEHYLHPSSSSLHTYCVSRTQIEKSYSYTNTKEKQQTLENCISQLSTDYGVQIHNDLLVLHLAHTWAVETAEIDPVQCVFW